MPKLPCVVFLEKHAKNGGVSEQGFKALRSVIGMISEMGWETHVIFEAKMATGVSVAVMEGHMERILQVCRVFKKSMKNGLVKVKYATNGLPDLKDEKGQRLDDEELEDALTTWGNKLRVLHEPDGNDKFLFQLIFLHYDATVHQRLTQLHRHRPYYGLGTLAMRSTELYYALKELHQIPEAADELVRDLKTVYREASDSLTEGFIPIALSSPVARKAAAPASKEATSAGKKSTPASKHARTARKESTPVSKELPANAASKPPQEESPQDEPRPARKAFKLVNAMITRRTQGHADTALNSNNTTMVPSSSQAQSLTTSPAREPATNPSDAACTSPISQTPLQRRPTFISRGTEIQERMIRGEFVTTRRPSVARGRGSTLSERRVEMEAWWLQAQAPRPNPPSGQSGSGPNCKNTA